MFDCFGVRLVPLFSKKNRLSKWPKSRENMTNMDIILLFLAKPLDKHGITLVHITYPPLPSPLPLPIVQRVKSIKYGTWYFFS